MIPLILLVLPLVTSSAIRAIPFGQPTPVETLISYPTAIAVDTDNFQAGDDYQAAQNVAPVSSSGSKSPESTYTTSTLVHQHESLPQIGSDDYYGYDDDDDDDDDELNEDEMGPYNHKDEYDEFGSYHPIGSSSDTTHVRRAGLEKRAIYRGTMQMDCRLAAEACQNACWYQNCMGAGDNQRYADGGFNTIRDNKNRFESGVTTDRGRPCSTWPFGQKFWDSYQFKKNPVGNERVLQTDEWPMASFENAPFDSTINPPQRSLRCISGQDNDRGGKTASAFRKKSGYYKDGQKWAHHRLGDRHKFNRGDTFNVAFNFEHFDMSKEEDQRIRKYAPSTLKGQTQRSLL